MRYLEIEVSITEVDQVTGVVRETSIKDHIEATDIRDYAVAAAISKMGTSVVLSHSEPLQSASTRF